MTDFEEQLARAMRRVDAPDGFAEKVMARAQAEESPRRGTLLRTPAPRRVWLSGALAAGMLGGVFWAGEVRLQRERAREALAAQQFEAGVRITDRTLDHVRQQLQRAGVQVGE